jgi:hypothetical protein
MKRRSFLASVALLLAAPLAGFRACPLEPTVEVALFDPLDGTFPMKALGHIPNGMPAYWDDKKQCVTIGRGILLGRCVMKPKGEA